MKNYFITSTQPTGRSAFLSKFFLSLGLLSVLVITLGAVTWLNNSQTDNRSKAAEETPIQPVATSCPQDQLECLDGSIVNRDPNNHCLFAACPKRK